jgi:NAD+ kinase
MNIKKVLVAYYVHNKSELNIIFGSLQKHNIPYNAVKRENLNLRLLNGVDLIITFGGDGTFLKAAQIAGSIPVFCVSSNKSKNEGFFARASPEDFHRKLARILDGNCKITKLPMLVGTICGKTKIYAINEIFVGCSLPQHMARYILKVNGKKEFQKSSGVLVSTPAGSHAWAKSAGSKQLPLTSNNFLYIVREPYIARLTPSKMIYGVLGTKQKVIITSQTSKGIAVADSSHRSYKLSGCRSIEIKKSPRYLKFIEF